jgi:hypothetical protein
MKFLIEQKVTRKYEVYFEAPDYLTADKVMDKLEDHMSDYDDPMMLPAVIDETRLVQKLGVTGMKVKEKIHSKSTGDPLSMEPDDLEIRSEVEWWNGNLNSFEIYDKLRDSFTPSQQRKLINYAKIFFCNCEELQYQLQDMADTLGVDLDEEE